MIGIPVVAIVTIITTLWYVDPSQAQWMPKCVFKLCTGLDCPSCGATRATYALVHGRFGEALAYNYFVVVALLYAGFAAVVAFTPRLHATRLRKIIFGKAAAMIYVTLFFGWWIVRNMTWFKELL